ncbi:HpcH/HpaI aldolase family protein [Homoserinibacter sp. YIM 151385]|uniref:HpcH/HpaI aldolase family protein n=1 Tax=Homoserinibacter sp. YIM 151385 TaxID=2985506 RepID=UPI0022F04629|nr:aldolase/citrate lyase family protein [Homoserinibacter sp. YIM 151385]WBU37079.1 aldolase/citrate lyase family protein [Homoserinibacter sp. YIM 151385]
MSVGRRPGFARALREADRALVGTWAKIPSLETVEILALAGFDFIVIDLEHAPLDLPSAYAATVVAQGLGLQVLVRVPDRSGSHLQRLLDSGVDGILVPRVETPEEAAAAASAMTFSPRGTRGNGSTSRAGAWGGIGLEEYLARGDDALRAVQIEDLDGLRAAPEILAVPHLTGAFLGMGDLQLSSGMPAGDPVIQAAVDRLLETAARHRIPVGTAVQTPEQVEAAARRGFAYVMVANDAGILRGAATSLVDDIRARLDA